MCQNDVTAFDLDVELSIGKRLDDGSLHFDFLFFSQKILQATLLATDDAVGSISLVRGLVKPQ
jgi:hypothetical protein